jgi:glycosyltransferase involved in cell wall biosynthesis
MIFFTRGNSLAKWHSIGLLEREIALYKALQSQGIHVSLLSYGRSEEEKFSSILPGIKVLYNKWNLPLPIYDFFCPWLHANTIRRADILRTNQIKGAHTALYAGLIWHKPVIVRMGYIWSKFLSQESISKRKASWARLYEDFVLKKASAIIVTTKAMQKEMLDRGLKLSEHLAIIPNYIDTDLFMPQPELKTSKEVLFVGRLSEQKNLPSLIEATSSLDVTLRIIGSGPLEHNLEEQASKVGGRVIFAGSYPNGEIPHALNQAAIFVLPSLYEGHPKALIEAMSCGLPVIGTDVEGIQDVIQHGETGWLCKPDPSSIRNAITCLLTNPNLRSRLGQRAREFVLENYSLKKIVNQEINIYNQVYLSR